MERLIGVDVGGTFTDIVELDEHGITGRKVPTSPNQSEGVSEAVIGDVNDIFMHGTTAATNALLEGKGSRVALVTDEGYEDLIEIGRQDRPSLYDSGQDRPRPLVSRQNRFGYSEDSSQLVSAMVDGDYDMVAVGLIESYDSPDAEIALAYELSEALGLPTIASTTISPEFREYERLATTVLSAYLTPSVAEYLGVLNQQLPMSRKLLMTSSGGLIPFEQAPTAAGRLVLSGPAGGAVAAAALGRHHGHKSVLSFDMGGTSTDVCRISDGHLSVGSGHDIAGRINRVPSVPIRTIGAGGGSVGWVDPGGALRVGPQSAGSVPGPACYLRGGVDATVTDANLAVGNIPDDLAMGGSVALDVQASQQAIRRLGDACGLDAEAVAMGILEIVDSHMEHALRSVSVEEGADPREAVLVAFGGAGGLHAVRLARRLGIKTVLIPPHSGVFSALGLMMASPRADSARTVMLAEGANELGLRLKEMSIASEESYVATFAAAPKSVSLSADVRYVGQSHELEVQVDSDWVQLRESFEGFHKQMYGFSRPGEPIEVVNVRAVATGEAPLSWSDLPPLSDDASPIERNNAWLRETLPAGFVVRGRAIVAESNSAVLVEDGSVLTVLGDGTLEIRT